MSSLDVFVHGRFAGSITAGPGLQATFEYDDAYLRGLRTPLSLSVPPLRRAHEAGMWIDGLLPDNSQVRDVWAARNHASGTRPIDLLATEIGADCAGAVQFFAAGAGITQRPSGVRALADRDIADWIRQARRDWSTWGGEGNLGQFSLGGAQAKCALHFDGRRWGLPYGDTPTTHILKPGLDDYEDAEVVEHVCMSAARHLGLRAAETNLVRFEDERVVAVTRFDRAPDSTAGTIRRVHQEDMCQALGVPSDKKYQFEGGPSPLDIAGLIRSESSDPAEDLRRFRDALIYNWVIAAPDAHAKNYSVFLVGSHVEMTPLYDVISYLPYAEGTPHGKLRTAMKTGKDYTLRKSSRPSAWERTARSLGTDPGETVERAVHLLESTPAAISDMIDALDAADRTSPVLAQLHRQSQIRSAQVRREFRPERTPGAEPQQTGAAQTSVRVVLCGAPTAAGSCRRRLVHRPCPLHPASPGSRAILDRQPPSAVRRV